MHYLGTLYPIYGVKGQPGVIWGNRGQILIFTKNVLSPLCYIGCSSNSYICISKFRPFSYSMRSKVDLRSFRVTGVKP